LEYNNLNPSWLLSTQFEVANIGLQKGKLEENITKFVEYINNFRNKND